MGVVTRVEEQKRNAGRVSVFVDGEYSFSVEKIVALAHNLKEGRELGDEEIERITSESDEETALKKALKFVAIRRRTRFEMIRYLSGKGYSGYVVGKTMDKLEYYGYVDDDEFVKDYVRAFSGKRGVRRIREDLKRLGIGEALAAKRLAGLSQDEACRNEMDRYLRTRPFDKAKVSRHLLSKGYESETVSRIVAEVSEE